MITNKIAYRYTKTELDQLLDSIVILIDTREKKNNHIINYFDQHEIKYKSKKLDYGDYSFMLPSNEELGIARDIYFNDQIVIERKASLEELSGNMTQDRARFENELLRANQAKFILLIEDEEGYKNILNHNYNTKYNPKAYLAGLMTFQHRYNITIQFLDPATTGNFIRYEFYYYLREYLK
ncbi:ERCC4 domain-containing protein [Natroniella sulfidigena]|uniref:ERCC4 domain-containing protein n=1 Tax=Natroniella sulfidigena TaxID=723921 RepID=UPI00200A93BC|nr:ERCC4 domain-containing protein [Natroniella sulfidigena]MCK8818116.1 ERCC4 domain-containing protein [Natroniella sulfidigena]